MCDNSRAAVIAKYTDKSRYKSEHIFGNVYVDERRIKLSEISTEEKNKHDKELKVAKRFAEHYNCEVFLIPEGDENGNAIFTEKNSNPDAIFQGYFIDFKQAKGSDRSITKRFGRGLGQAEGIIITIENDTSIEKAVQWINGSLNAMKHSHDGFIVIIEDRSGNYGIYSINGKRLSVEENLSTAAQRLSPPDIINNNTSCVNVNP